MFGFKGKRDAVTPKELDQIQRKLDKTHRQHHGEENEVLFQKGRLDSLHLDEEITREEYEAGRTWLSDNRGAHGLDDRDLDKLDRHFADKFHEAA